MEIKRQCIDGESKGSVMYYQCSVLFLRGVGKMVENRVGIECCLLFCHILLFVCVCVRERERDNSFSQNSNKSLCD